MNVSRAHLKLVTSNYSIVKCQLEICRPGGNIGRRGHLVESAPPNGVCLSNSPTCCNLLPPTILPSQPPLNPQPRHPPTSHPPYSISTSSLPTPNSIHLLFTPSQSTTLFASLLLSLVCQIHIKSIWTCIVKVTN